MGIHLKRKKIQAPTVNNAQHFQPTRTETHSLCTLLPTFTDSACSCRMSQLKAVLAKSLPLIASGKVRELYEVNPNTLLFVASDRISAYDVIMDNVSF